MEAATEQGRVSHSLVAALRSVPSLAPLDEEALLCVVGDSANLFWPAGSIVFERGTPSDGLYIVLEGTVRVFGDEGRELAELGPGDYFGEFSLLLGTAHQHEVRTAEASELMVVSKERFDALLSENPELADSIRRTAEERRAANLDAPAA